MVQNHLKSKITFRQYNGGTAVGNVQPYIEPLNKEYSQTRTPAERGAESATVTSPTQNIAANTWENPTNPITSGHGISGYAGEPFSETIGKRSFGLNYSSRGTKDKMKHLERQFGGDYIVKNYQPFFGNAIMNREMYGGEIETGKLYTELDHRFVPKSEDEITNEVFQKLRFDEIYDDIKKARENDGNWQGNQTRGFIPRSLRSMGKNVKGMVNEAKIPLAKPVSTFEPVIPIIDPQTINNQVRTADLARGAIQDNEKMPNLDLISRIDKNPVTIDNIAVEQLERPQGLEPVGHTRFLNYSDLVKQYGTGVELQRQINAAKKVGMQIRPSKINTSPTSSLYESADGSPSPKTPSPTNSTYSSSTVRNETVLVFPKRKGESQQKRMLKNMNKLAKK